MTGWIEEMMFPIRLIDRYPAEYYFKINYDNFEGGVFSVDWNIVFMITARKEWLTIR